MATKPELRRAVANSYIKASDYNYNFEQLNNYIENGVADNAINKYEADREYGKNEWVLAGIDGQLSIFQSLVDGNKGNSLLDGNYWKQVSLGGSHTMFDTVLKDHILTYEETKGLALQGTYVYKNAIAGSRYGYPDFYNKVVEEKESATATEVTLGNSTITMYIASNGHQYYDIVDKNIVDAFFYATGTAWFYGVDTEQERVFLPRNNYFEQLTTDTTEVGQSVEAGLPNIKGDIHIFSNSNVSKSGVFTDSYSNGSRHVEAANGGIELVFDASDSNPIYKDDCDTVQPPAVKKLLYICVGNTTNYEGLTDVVNQGMEILEQVNQGIESRVKLDGSNAEFIYVTEAYQNGTSWYRIWSDGWCEQGGRTNALDSDIIVTLLKPYIDTNYTILVTPYNPVAVCCFHSQAQAVDSFSCWVGNANGGAVVAQRDWMTCGFIR